MEESLKKDVRAMCMVVLLPKLTIFQILREIVAGNGRILLHDEVEDRPGSFSIVPIWETITKGMLSHCQVIGYRGSTF
jgi:hypothetical protein